MSSATGGSAAESGGSLTSDAGTATATTSTTTANIASWLLVVAFVALVLSVVVPAMGDGARADWAAALLFMCGLAATLVGTGMAVASSVSTARAVFGGLVMLVGLVLMYGIVPSIAALGVVLDRHRRADQQPARRLTWSSAPAVAAGTAGWSPHHRRRRRPEAGSGTAPRAAPRLARSCLADRRPAGPWR